MRENKDKFMHQETEWLFGCTVCVSNAMEGSSNNCFAQAI